MDSARADQSIDPTMDRIEREAKRAAQAKAEQARFSDTQGASAPFEWADPMALAAQLGARVSWTIQGGFAPIELVEPPGQAL